jgi:hypothetical protein
MEDTELGVGEDVTDEDYISTVKEFVRTNKWMTFDIIFNKITTLSRRGWTRFGLLDIVGKNWVLIQIMVYCYIPVLILGLVGMLRYSSPRTRMITLPMVSYALFHIILTIFKQRYRLPIEPGLVALAGIPLASIPFRNALSGFDWTKAITSLKEKVASMTGTTIRSIKAAAETVWAELRKDMDIILVLLSTAVALRIYFALAIEIQKLPSNSQAMNDFALSGGMTSVNAPLYPMFLRAIYLLFGAENFTAVFIIQGLINSAGIVMLYILISRLWTRRAGIIAMALATIYPRFLSYCIMIKPLSVGIFLVITLLLLSRFSISDRTRGIFSGIIIGLVIMLEPFYMYLVPGTFAVLTNSRKAFLLTLLIILAPLTIRNTMAERHIVPVYASSAYKVNLHKFEVLDSSRLPNELYQNISVILGRDWRDNYESGMEPSVRNFNYINVYSYIIIMLIGMAGLIKYGNRDNLKTMTPVLGYIVLLIFLTQMYDKVETRVLWEPMLIVYSAMLISRHRPPDESIHKQ